eukprot:2594750-Amphidinium_carterae.1
MELKNDAMDHSATNCKCQKNGHAGLIERKEVSPKTKYTFNITNTTCATQRQHASNSVASAKRGLLLSFLNTGQRFGIGTHSSLRGLWWPTGGPARAYLVWKNAGAAGEKFRWTKDHPATPSDSGVARNTV